MQIRVHICMHMHAHACRLHAGTVWVNTYLMGDVGIPFGGYKGSGYGRSGTTTKLHYFDKYINVSIKLNLQIFIIFNKRYYIMTPSSCVCLLQGGGGGRFAAVPRDEECRDEHRALINPFDYFQGLGFYY